MTTIQQERWLVSYNFKTHDGKGEITHVVLNYQDSEKPWDGEQLQELVAIAREDVCMKLDMDENVDGEVLGEFVLTGVTPLGLVNDISISFDEEVEGDMVDDLLDEQMSRMPGTTINVFVPAPESGLSLENLKGAFSAVGEVASRALGGVLQLASPAKKEPLQ